MDSSEGISQEVSDLLKRRSDRQLSAEAQWYLVWDVVFANEPRPTSAYLGTTVAETFRMMESFMQEEGPQIVRTILARTGMPDGDNLDLEVLLLELLHEVELRFERTTPESTSGKTSDIPTLSPSRDAPAPSQMAPSTPLNSGFDFVDWNVFDFQPAISACLQPPSLQTMDNGTASAMGDLEWAYPACDFPIDFPIDLTEDPTASILYEAP
ncbi:hypothetical protein NKR23_g10920 [Pleurostoma richardsiae]|uniref:Uncharacterized protein n=1 Tax=Pleurostoma richardsiae TaxID=41990 RepID=A0AA38R8U9_9PEZI|nr:hypothetical protein NKR23_g10920 [Pleurostoma richardsiae]